MRVLEWKAMKRFDIAMGVLDMEASAPTIQRRTDELDGKKVAIPTRQP